MVAVLALALFGAAMTLMFKLERWRRRRALAHARVLAPPGWTVTELPGWFIRLDVRGVHRGRWFAAHVTGLNAGNSVVDLAYQPTACSPAMLWESPFRRPQDPTAAAVSARRVRLGLIRIEAPMEPGPLVRTWLRRLTRGSGAPDLDRLQDVLDELIGIAQELEAGRASW
jgi:hypothetical protein